MKSDKQMFLPPSGNLRRHNAQNDPNSPRRSNKKESSRPGHDIEDLIVFPECLEGEICSESKCKSDN